MNKIKLYYFSWLFLILLVSSIPNLSAGKIEFAELNFSLRLDYVFHFLEYFVLALLFVLWKIHQKSVLVILQIFSFGLLFAVADEFHQKLIPGRVYNPVDIFYNVMGIIIGIVTFLIFRKYLISLNKVAFFASKKYGN